MPLDSAALCGVLSDAPDLAAPDCVVERAVLEAALNRRIGPLRFEPGLEQAYHRDTGAARITRIAACNVLGSITFTVNTAQVADIVAVISAVMQPLRYASIVFIVLAAVFLYGRRHTLPAWVAETLTSLGSLLIAAYALMVAHYPPDDPRLIIQTGALFTLFLHSGLAARQQFRYALGTGLLVLAAYLVVARSHGDLQALIVAGNVRLLITAFVFTMLANYVLEHRERRAYVLRSLQAHSRRALADSAAALRRLSLHDALTGLANRRHFDAELRGAWQAAAVADRPLAVLQMDVDFFKRYNDHYGHPAGDVCLKRVAEALHLIAKRRAGLAARTGGEEFAMLLPQCTLDTAAEIGEEVRCAVRALALAHADSSVAPCVTLSVGVAAAVPHSAQEASKLLSAADAALYDAKRAGRDRVARSAGAQSTVHADVLRQPPAQPLQSLSRPPLPPDRETVVDPGEAFSPLAQRIVELTHVLRHGLGRLRFPPPLETAYQAAIAPARARWLPRLGVGGLLCLLLYVWMSRALLGDVADSSLHVSLLLTALLLPLLAWMRRPLAAWLREMLFSASAVALCVGILLALSRSQSITMYSYALSFFLVPMFSAVIAAQPFRYGLATSLAILCAVVLGLYPARPEWFRIWMESSLLQAAGLSYTLVGGYLIDLSARRHYVLGQLAEAQHALLATNMQRLRQQADADPLTGLANRRKFDAELESQIKACAEARRPLALLIVDIDHFKRYNDHHGHPAGDACLRRVAGALGRSLEVVGVQAARLGGEEFGLLLPDCDTARALLLARTVCDRVRGLGVAHLDSPVGPWVTVSIGAASIVPALDSEPSGLLELADAALYRAKHQGRDRAAG